MAARITAAQARALGIDPKVGRTRTTQRAAKGFPYRTQCTTCATIFDTRAAEDRHVNETRHGNYRLLP